MGDEHPKATTMIKYLLSSLSIFIMLLSVVTLKEASAEEGRKNRTSIPDMIEVTETPKTPWIIEKSGHYLAKNILTVKSANGTAVVIKAHNVTLEGFEIEATRGTAVVVEKSKRFILKKTSIKNSQVAFDLNDSQISIQSLSLSETDQLMRTEGSNTLRISQSRFSGPFSEPFTINTSAYVEINDSNFYLEAGEGLQINDQAVASFRNTQFFDCGNQSCLTIDDQARVHFMSSGITQAEEVAIMARGNSQAILQEVKIQKAKVGVLAAEESRIILKNSRIEDAQSIACLAINRSGIRLENNRFDSGIVGLKLKDEATAIVTENDFLNFKGVAISVNEKSSINGSMNRVSENQGTGMLVMTSGEVNWSHNFHQANLLQGMEVIDLQAGNVTANIITDNKGDGIYIEKVTSLGIINGNIIQKNGGCNIELPKYLVSTIITSNTVEDGPLKICLLPPSDDY